MFHFEHGRQGRGMRGGRARGEMKYEILACLMRGPRHGYDIMLELEAKTGMRPSPGSIYPALQMLEDGDFIRGRERDGKRTYEITDKGLELLSQRETPEPDAFGGEDLHRIIADAMRQMHGIKDAVKQIARSGNVESYKKAVAVLDKTRRELFSIIADHI